jgi:Ras-related protein Rap-1B
MVFVGNKFDLVDDRAGTRLQAFKMFQDWDRPYYEASARTRNNVDEVFIDACRQYIRKEESNSRNDHSAGLGPGKVVPSWWLSWASCISRRR